jgi:hypothetical protein
VNEVYLAFNYFGVGAGLDLRCHTVRVMAIENTPLKCRDIPILGGKKDHRLLGEG